MKVTGCHPPRPEQVIAALNGHYGERLSRVVFVGSDVCGVGWASRPPCSASRGTRTNVLRRSFAPRSSNVSRGTRGTAGGTPTLPRTRISAGATYLFSKN